MSLRYTPKTNTVEPTDGATPTPSLLDQLITRRTQIARQAKDAVAKLDRQINLLRQSEAETIIREAEEALNNSF